MFYTQCTRVFGNVGNVLLNLVFDLHIGLFYGSDVSAYYSLSVPCDCFLLCHFFVVFNFLSYVAITE